MGGVVLGILVWQEGGEYVGLLIGLGAGRASAAWPGGCAAASGADKPTLLDPALFRSKPFRTGVSGQLLQQIALGGTMIVLPIYLQMVLEYNALQAGISIAPLSLSMFAVALLAGRGRASAGRRASSCWASCCWSSGWSLLVPLVPRATLGLVARDPAASSPAAGWGCSSRS